MPAVILQLVDFELGSTLNKGGVGGLLSSTPLAKMMMAINDDDDDDDDDEEDEDYDDDDMCLLFCFFLERCNQALSSNALVVSNAVPTRIKSFPLQQCISFKLAPYMPKSIH